MTNANEVFYMRTTLDGRLVMVWADGLITDAVGNALHGLGRKKVPADIAYMFAGEVCLMNRDEVPRAAERVRAAAKRGPIVDPGSMRDVMYAEAAKPKVPTRRRDEKNCPAHGTLREHIWHCRRVFGCRVCG